MPSTANEPATANAVKAEHPGYLRVTWDEVDHMINTLSGMLSTGAYQCENILAVARGGLVPARLLSAHFEKLGRKVPIQYVTATSYEGESQGEISLNFHMLVPDLSDLNKRSTLVIDDLWDTGQTFKALIKHLPQAAYATLMSKKTNHPQLDYCAWTASPDIAKWVVFPWEEPRTPRNRGVLERDFHNRAQSTINPDLSEAHVEKARDLWKNGEAMNYILNHLKSLSGNPHLKVETVRKAIFGDRP